MIIIKMMTNDQLLNELIDTSYNLGEWSMETYNPTHLNEKQNKRYSEIKKEILSRMNRRE